MNKLPNPLAYLNIHGFAKNDLTHDLTYHVEVNEFPEGADYLQGAVLSQDESRPGWVTMPVLEAGDGEITDHAFGVKDLHFRIPEGYNVGADGHAVMRFRFVKDDHSIIPSEYYQTTETIGDPNEL